jgi:hypothetical protein
VVLELKANELQAIKSGKNTSMPITISKTSYNG